MSGIVENAGLMPAFVDYERLGARYGRLIGQFRNGGRVHAYLLVGPKGIGKKTFARYLSSVLFCENRQPPCLACAQCAAVHGGTHVSVTEITPVGNKTSIPVERIREIVSLSSMHSLDGRAKVVIIEPMESLTPQAQNSLLKSLEEPDTNIVYFLLSHDASSLLDTIVSRCASFKLTPWPSEILTDHLRGLGYPEGAVQRAASLSGGNIGEALDLLAAQPGDTAEEALHAILTVASARDAVRCSTYLKDLASGADQVLYRLERYLQQCLLIKSNLLPADILRDTPWQGYLEAATVPKLAEITEHIFKARKLRMSNVNWQSNIDQLTGKLLEATRKWQKS